MFTEKYGAEPPKKLKVFPAAYEGTCAECGYEIIVDDPVAFYEDDLCHESCAIELIELE